MPTSISRLAFHAACVAAALLVLGSGPLAAAQQPAPARTDDPARWEKDIKAFEAADAASPPPKGGIVFVGSSSIRLWTTLAQDFPGKPVLNRGFGGSQLSDAVHFAPRIVIPYAPRLIVVYAGGNDIAAGESPEQVAGDFRRFVETIRKALPATRIAFISIAGNPARWAQVEQVKTANRLVEAYTKQVPNLAYIDVFTRMLGADGLPLPHIFVADRLHMNAEGYKIWTSVVGPHLEAAGPAPQPAGVRQKVLLDTDIGTDIDDAWALGYVLKSPSFDVIGVTVSDADTAARARLACKLLHRIGRTDVPVAVGRATAAVPPDRVDYQFTWAEDFTAYRPVPAPAADFLAESIRRHPNQVVLIAVGPLQNLGDLVRKHPDTVKLVKRVVLMSGSIGPNAWSSSAVAEWNVKLAIEEAQAVYAAGWPVTIVPLDSTSYVRLEDGERDGLRKAGTPLVVALEALYRLWADWPTSRMTLHDQLAVAEAQEPGAFFGRCTTMPLRVDGKGFTIVDAAGGRPVSVCLEPKRDAFMKHYLAQLQRP